MKVTRCMEAGKRCLLPKGHEPLVLGDDDDAVKAPHLVVPPDLAGLLVPIDELTPHPENPRQGDVGSLTLSLVRFGVLAPARVQESTGYMAAGNHTWKAGKALGAIAWPRVRIDLSDRETSALLIADNRLHDLGSYDERALAPILSRLAAEGALSGIGYDTEDVDDLLKRIAEPEPPTSFTDASDPETQYRCPKCSYAWSGAPK